VVKGHLSRCLHAYQQQATVARTPPQCNAGSEVKGSVSSKFLSAQIAPRSDTGHKCDSLSLLYLRLNSQNYKNQVIYGLFKSLISPKQEIIMQFMAFKVNF